MTLRERKRKEEINIERNDGFYWGKEKTGEIIKGWMLLMGKKKKGEVNKGKEIVDDLKGSKGKMKWIKGRK